MLFGKPMPHFEIDSMLRFVCALTAATELNAEADGWIEVFLLRSETCDHMWMG